MENLDSTVIVTTLPQMTPSFGVTAYALRPAEVTFAATVALAPIAAPRWPAPWSSAIGALASARPTPLWRAGKRVV
jgi:hypothetical protein